ncbi:hypothetical protein GOP47_0027059 [Adiantum capillus-veneris]|nr:hypothetical protein GOP47_0027059 [Adiantum capillus-veneris]
MEQTNRSSGHKRAIKLFFPSSFQNPNSNFFNKVEHSIEVDSSAPIARFQLHSSCLLVIRTGDIVNWAVDGRMDAVVSPRRSWGFQAGRCKDMNGSLVSSRMQTFMTDICSYSDEAEHRHGSDENIASGLQKEQAKRSVSALLHSAAGPELKKSLQKCVQFATSSRCGDAVITSGFKLPASHIIHAIVPKYRSSENVVMDSSGLLERAYQGALALATANGMRYVAFPAMACGGGGFPVGVAAQAAGNASGWY